MKIVNIESFPIRVSNQSDKGRKIDTKNINTAMLANNELSEKADSYEAENKSDTKRYLEVKSMDSYETIIKDMGEYYIDDGSKDKTGRILKSFKSPVVLLKLYVSSLIPSFPNSNSPFISFELDIKIVYSIVLVSPQSVYDIELELIVKVSSQSNCHDEPQSSPETEL